MKRFYLAALCFSLVIAGGALINPVSAEVLCSSDVSYSWEKDPSVTLNGGNGPSKDQAGSPKADGTGAGATPVEARQDASKAPPGASPPPSTVVFFMTVERGGVDEGRAKGALLVELNRQKTRALERCRKDHESTGDCIATKLSTKASVLNSLSFSARAQLETALLKECETQHGRCLTADSSEPRCREGIAIPAAGSPGSPGEKKEGGAPAAGGAKKAEEGSPKVESSKAKPSKKN